MPRFKKRKSILNQYMSLVQNVASEADLYIAGDIVDMEWWDEDVTPQKILDGLYDAGEINTLNLVINSYGGSVNAGTFIIDLLDDYKEKNNTFINVKIANAYSMATGIAMVGDKVSMYQNGVFMIHKPLTYADGNATDFRKMADILDVYEKGLVKNYMRKFKGTEEELLNLLEEETYLTAEQAVELGFVDDILEPLQIVASGKGIKSGNVLFTRKEVVDILTPKINESEVKNKMKYSEILMTEYGISEETFNGIDDMAVILEFITAKTKALVDQAKEDTKKEIEEASASKEETVNLTNEELSVLELEDVTNEAIINLALKGKRITPELENSFKDHERIATEHKRMKQNVVDEAVKMGIRAMGAENFDKGVFEKTLTSMAYDDVLVVLNNWTSKAQQDLNAGKRASQPITQVENKHFGKTKNTQDYSNVNTNF